MQALAYNTAATTFTTATAQITIAPAKVDMIVKNVFFAAIVALIAVAVNM